MSGDMMMSSIANRGKFHVVVAPPAVRLYSWSVVSYTKLLTTPPSSTLVRTKLAGAAARSATALFS